MLEWHVGQLSYGDESIRRASANRRIVRAEVGNGPKTNALKDPVEIGSRPTSHHEAIIARMFSSIVDQSVPFGQKKLLALRIEFGGARERELASIRKNAPSKNGLALLPLPRRLPFANVQNQNTRTSQRARERGKHREPCVVVHEVVENAEAQNAVVPCHR